MSKNSGELQIISVERNGYSNARGTSVRRSKRGRRRRKSAALRLRASVAALLVLGLLSGGFAISALKEIPVGLAVERESPEQFAECEDYPKELVELLEQNEETYDFVENYAKREQYQGKEIDLSDDYRAGSVPLLMQWDKRWGYDLYGDSMIGLSGCGPTCMTMAYLYYKGDTTMNPRKMAEFAQEQGYHTEEGTSWDFWTAGAESLGLSGETVSLSETVMKSVLDAGGLLVLSMLPGDFTTGGHYILLRGYDENGFFVNDPNRNSNSEKQWDYDTLARQIKNLWAIYG